MKRGVKKKEKDRLYDLLIRYLILILIALPGLTLFYTIFRPLTAYPVYWILELFYEADMISPTIILLNGMLPIELVEACIAGAAYYLLLILNLSTPEIKLNKRIKMLLIGFGAFLILNIIRIVVLSFMAYNGSSFFDITHRLFWYGFSTVFVVLIWFAQVKYYKIKRIPFYSDLKFLHKYLK